MTQTASFEGSDHIADAPTRLRAFQVLQHLIFEGLPAEGITLSSTVTITTSAETKEAIGNDSLVMQGFGHIQMRSILEAHAIAISMTEQYTGSASHALAVFPRIFLSEVKHFLLALWLIKDNSGNCSPVFVCLNTGPKAAGSIQGHDSMSLNARCRLDPVTFLGEEVGLALRYYAQFETLIPRMRTDPLAPSVTGVIDKNRTSRALYLVQAARNAGDVGFKGAFYCMCFEALFSTGHTELNHRVSERTAQFVGKPGADRRGIYTDIQALYALRSPVAHGSSIEEKKLPSYVELLVRCDGYLRRCLRRILDSAELLDLFAKTDNADLTAYFLDELFPQT